MDSVRYQCIITYESLFLAEEFINWQLILKGDDFQTVGNGHLELGSPESFNKNVNYLDAFQAYKIKYLEGTLI